MTDRFSCTWTKIVDSKTGASLETGNWVAGHPGNGEEAFAYRAYAKAEPFALSFKWIKSKWKYAEEGRAVKGFLIVKDIIDRQLKNARDKSPDLQDTLYCHSYVVLLMSEFLRFLKPSKPKYSITYLVCHADVERYRQIGEDGLYTTIDELLNDERIKIIWSAK